MTVNCLPFEVWGVVLTHPWIKDNLLKLFQRRVRIVTDSILSNIMRAIVQAITTKSNKLTKCKKTCDSVRFMLSELNPYLRFQKQSHERMELYLMLNHLPNVFNKIVFQVTSYWYCF